MARARSSRAPARLRARAPASRSSGTTSGRRTRLRSISAPTRRSTRSATDASLGCAATRLKSKTAAVCSATALPRSAISSTPTRSSSARRTSAISRCRPSRRRRAPRIRRSARRRSTRRTDALLQPMVYVGANDGMLHAFDAATGVEHFAYVPSTLIPELNRAHRSDLCAPLLRRRPDRRRRRVHRSQRHGPVGVGARRHDGRGR